MTSESASTPTGSVPGMRLASAENALRAFPGGKRKGAVTNPGRRSSSGRKARLATSIPDTTDPRKKLTASLKSAPSRSHAPLAGRRARLVQVAPATAASPTGRSAAFQPESEEENRSRRRSARKARRSIVLTRAQGRSPFAAAISDLPASEMSARRLGGIGRRQQRRNIAAPPPSKRVADGSTARAQSPYLRFTANAAPPRTPAQDRSAPKVRLVVR